MPKALDWTPFADATIRRLRMEGATWQQIGLALGVSRNTVIERGRRLRAGAPPRFVPPQTIPEDLERPPLPAGHEKTWGLICSEEFPK